MNNLLKEKGLYGRFDSKGSESARCDDYDYRDSDEIQNLFGYVDYNGAYYRADTNGFEVE
jgi:hypothetical protein